MTVTPLHYNPDASHRGGPGEVIALVDDYWLLAQRISTTEFVPTHFRRRPEAVLAALLSGAERGFGPMESLRLINVIEGKPGLSAEAMRALVLAAGHDIEIVESNAQRATLVGTRHGTERPSPPFTWTIDRARRARLANKPNWQQYPEAMLLARATTDLCRAVFPDVTAGLASIEELEDMTPISEPATTGRRQKARPTIAPAPTPTAELAPQTPTEPPQPATAPIDVGGIPGADQPTWGTSIAPEPVAPADPAISRRIHAELAQAFPGANGAQRDRWRHALVAVVTRRRPDGPQTSSTGISLEEQLALSKLVTNITAGNATVTDGPDNTVELHAGGGWRYTIRLDPVAVTVHRGDQDTGEGNAAPHSADPSPDQTSLDGLED